MAKQTKKRKPVRKTVNRKSRKGSNKNLFRALSVTAILVMLGGICYGFVKLEDFVRNDIVNEQESSVRLVPVDKPDWVNQELLKRINETAKMGLNRLPVVPETAKMVQQNLENHLKWLTDITVRTTNDAIEMRAKYRKPVALLKTNGGMYYVDEDLFALDYIPINSLSIVEITGFRNKQNPIPGRPWREDDIAAAVKLIRMLQEMDKGQKRKLIYEIESVDVSNYSKRGSSVSQLIIKTIDNGPEILWGAEPGQAAANVEMSEEEKLMSLYEMFRSKGTLKDKYKYIDLRYPKD
jgi:hypothetical protein